MCCPSATDIETDTGEFDLNLYLLIQGIYWGGGDLLSIIAYALFTEYNCICSVFKAKRPHILKHTTKMHNLNTYNYCTNKLT